MPTIFANQRPIWFYLAALCAALTVPILCVSAYMTWSFADSERARLKSDVSDVNKQVVVALERQQTNEISMMHTLATARSLLDGDVDSFSDRARSIVKSRMPYADIILQGIDGTILLDTGREFTNQRSKPVLKSAATAEHEPTISNLKAGATFAESAYFVTVPVSVQGEIRYFLKARMPVQRLADLITEQNLAPGYFVSIVDGDGHLLARSAENEKHFGKKLPGVVAAAGHEFFEWSGTNPQGVLVYGVIRREKLTDWSVTTGIAQELLHAPLNRSLAWILSMAAASFAFGCIIAFAASRALSRAARQIIETAGDLGEGKNIAPLVTSVTEANVIGAALKAASDKLRHQAEALISANQTLECRVDERTEELAAKTRLLETTLANMDQGLLLVDTDGFIRLHNAKAADLIELPEELLRTQPNVRDTIAYLKAHGIIEETPEDVAVMLSRDGLVPGKTVVHERERPNGKVIEVRTVPLDGGQLVRTYTDVTLRKHAERHLQHLARYDSLTQLPNRLHFREHLEQAMAFDRRYGKPFSVMFIDVDHFKTVNDVHGHGVGDALLMEVAACFRTALRMEDTVARFGGDEFAVLQAGGGEDGGPEALARRLLKSVSQTIRVDEINLNVGISIGIATCPRGDITADEIMRRADTALYQAKRSGRNRFCVFEETSAILKAS